MTVYTGPPSPPPGSDEARERGCLCPVIDNRRGRGMYDADDGEPMYVMRDDCPMHGTEAM